MQRHRHGICAIDNVAASAIAVKSHAYRMVFRHYSHKGHDMKIHTLLIRLFLPLATALAMVCSQQTMAESLPPGKSHSTFIDDRGRPDKPVKIWYFKPASMRSDARVLFVMHGNARDGETYLDQWMPYAEKYHVLLIVPQFPKKGFPSSEYQMGNVTDPDREKWTFSMIEHLFDKIRTAEALQANSYYLFGHSAGAQFVHRFMLFMPAPRVAMAVAANAGSYTLPLYPSAANHAYPFPWSLTPSLVSETQRKAVFARRLVILLGEEDTKHNKDFPDGPEASMQGNTRLARGQNFYRVAQQQATALQTPLAWQLHTVPDVGHSDAGMAPAAASYLFDAQ
jgi:pimeloyl-ACP methyl ester carboxylesterase